MDVGWGGKEREVNDRCWFFRYFGSKWAKVLVGSLNVEIIFCRIQIFDRLFLPLWRLIMGVFFLSWFGDLSRIWMVFGFCLFGAVFHGYVHATLWQQFKLGGVSLRKDSEVSISHGKFENTGGKVTFTDVGSTNGTDIEGWVWLAYHPGAVFLCILVSFVFPLHKAGSCRGKFLCAFFWWALCGMPPKCKSTL